MGNCASKSNPVVEAEAPPPHAQARKLWLIAVPLDQQQIPVDLAGIDSGGLKAAMLHRGLEAEHWALKVDPAAGEKSSAQVFDITLERNGMSVAAHSIASPLFSSVTRRQHLGWTIWNDAEILHATRMLVQARPNYDGRNNNFQQLARILAKHVQYTPPVDTSSANSMVKPSAPPSQTTEPSQPRTDSTESSSEQMGTVSPGMAPPSAAGSFRQTGQGRPRPSVLPKSNSVVDVSETSERPPLNRAALSEQQAQKLQAARRSGAFASSPLNPEKQPTTTLDKQQQQQRQRTRSDVSATDKRVSRQHPREQSREDRRRSTVSQSQTGSRRKSQIPAEWAGDAYRSGESQAGGSVKRMSRRDSQMNFAPPPPLPHNGTWSSAYAPPTPPMMAVPMPMSPYDMQPGMSPYMAGYGMPMSGSMHSLHGQPGQMQMGMARPMSFYGPPLSMPWGMAPPPPITMLGPPSPGAFNSSRNSLVPTPPESPMPPFDSKQLHAMPPSPAGQNRVPSAGHSRHASAR